jgi:hypothetical protein
MGSVAKPLKFIGSTSHSGEVLISLIARARIGHQVVFTAICKNVVSTTCDFERIRKFKKKEKSLQPRLTQRAIPCLTVKSAVTSSLPL